MPLVLAYMLGYDGYYCGTCQGLPLRMAHEAQSMK